jgi:hypothetical protein
MRTVGVWRAAMLYFVSISDLPNFTWWIQYSTAFFAEACSPETDSSSATIRSSEKFLLSRKVIKCLVLISLTAIENVKRTQLNEWWRPMMGMCQSKRLHTWHMYLLDAVGTRQQV